MDDSRLMSMHLEFPRRQQYRHARQALLQARGCLTLAGEEARAIMSGMKEWVDAVPSPSAVPLLGTHYVLLDQHTNEAYPLRVGLNAIGRYPNNNIVFTDKCVSRRHCAILVHVRGGCELHDTASRNGTFVNGKRVEQPVKLSSGDRLKLATRDLLFARIEDCVADAPDGDTSITPLA
jgi:hypothetical protein